MVFNFSNFSVKFIPLYSWQAFVGSKDFIRKVWQYYHIKETNSNGGVSIEASKKSLFMIKIKQERRCDDGEEKT